MVNTTNPRGDGAAPSSDARFLVLEVPVGGPLKKRILGSVIPRCNTSNAFECYSPWLDDPTLSEAHLHELGEINKLLWKDEEGNSVTLNDTSMDGSRQTQTGAQAQLTDFFRASISKAKKQDVHIKAGTARRYMIDCPDNALPAFLFNNPLWKDQLQQMYNRLGDAKYPDKKLAIITGVWTCEGLEVSWKRETSNNANVAAKVIPASVAQMAAGDPGIVAKMDVHLQVDQKRSNAQEVIANCQHEVVFALAYHELVPVFTEKLVSTRSWGFFKRTVSEKTKHIERLELGLPIRGSGIDAYAGDHDDIETVSDFYYQRPRYAPLEHATQLPKERTVTF